MSDDEIVLTTADMLEIVASGGNGAEYVNIPSIMEKAAKELRDAAGRIAQLEADIAHADAKGQENDKLLWGTIEWVKKLEDALQDAKRACEMSATIIRDKRRTKAMGAVAEMVERIACQFDRVASKARAALEDRT
jgi:hypothetical protein